MRPLFAIVPLVALLAWLGEPPTAEVANATEAPSAATQTASSQHRTMLNAPSLGTSLISTRAPATTGNAHLMSTSWAPAR